MNTPIVSSWKRTQWEAQLTYWIARVVSSHWSLYISLSVVQIGNKGAADPCFIWRRCQKLRSSNFFPGLFSKKTKETVWNFNLKFRFIKKIGTSYRSNFHRGSACLYSSSSPMSASSVFPRPLLPVGLSVPRCLDDVPLGLLLVLLR